MKKHIILTNFILFLILLMSCGDNNTSPSENKKINYIPISIGNYWIYKTYNINRFNQYTNSENPRIDSIVIEEKLEKNEKTAYKFINYIIKENIYQYFQESFYYTDENDVYESSINIQNNLKFDSIPLSIPIQFKEKWIRIISNDKNNWIDELIKYENYKYSFIYDHTLVPAVIDGEFVFKAMIGEKDTISIDNKIFYTNTFMNRFIINAKIAYYGAILNIDIRRKITYWCVKDLGIVKKRIEPLYQEIQMPLINKTFIIDLPGSESFLIKYIVQS